MTQLRNNKQGFGTIEVLLLLVIVVMLGFVGWYVYQAKTKTNNLLNNTAKTNVTAATKQKVNPSGTPLSTTQTGTKTTTSSTNNTSTKTSTTADSTANNGISGQVYLANSNGNCPASGCPTSSGQPYQATIQIKTRDGTSLVTTVTSDSSGAFTVKLPPGNYLLVPQDTNNGHTSSQNQAVTVQAGNYAKVSVVYTSAIP